MENQTRPHRLPPHLSLPHAPRGGPPPHAPQEPQEAQARRPRRRRNAPRVGPLFLANDETVPRVAQSPRGESERDRTQPRRRQVQTRRYCSRFRRF